MRVVVGMSGGVDSSVSAALLQEAGYEVIGVFMKNWPPAPDSEGGLKLGNFNSAETPAARIDEESEYGDGIGAEHAAQDYSCTWREDRRDAMRVAAILDIPFQTWDFSREYREAVVSYMIREYAEGRTPNPDVMCNKEIKFGLFYEKARALGADFVATGHYARVTCNKGHETSNEPHAACRLSLAAARDLNKDQSYFLWTLTKEHVKHALFPLGDLTKSEVRALAKKFGLPTAEKPDSQGICFVGEIDVPSFLRDHIPSSRGAVVTAAGKKVGEHDGVQFYTIGQRHGIGLGGGIPYYVAGKDLATNTLVVAEGPYDKALFVRDLTAVDVNWISEEPEFPLSCLARIRYRQPLQACVVTPIHANASTNSHETIREYSCSNSRKIRVTFREEQRAVTPGQSVVFYREDDNPSRNSGRSSVELRMLGGAVIS